MSRCMYVQYGMCNMNSLVLGFFRVVLVIRLVDFKSPPLKDALYPLL